MNGARDYSAHPLQAVGVGNVGSRHAETYAGQETCRLKWVYDRDHEAAICMAAGYDGVQVADRFEAIIEDEEVDLISICSYDGDHYGQVIAALETGKDLFVEKPLCGTIDKVRHIKECWQKAGKPALDFNLMSRGSPLYQWLSVFVERGGLGDIYAIDAEYWYGRLHKITDGWRRKVKDYSVMQGGEIHLMDTVFMMTDQWPTSCIAVGNRICTEGTEFRYNDFVTAIFRFPSTMVARVIANFGCIHRDQHVLRVFVLLDLLGRQVGVQAPLESVAAYA